MKSSRVIAAATGVMIGVGGILPAANAQPPAAVSTLVAAGHGQDWGLKQARQQFRIDVKRANKEYRTDVRKARREFRKDIREARHVSQAKYQEARKQLRAALRTARGAFHTAIKEANEIFQTSVADSRAALLKVLKDPASTMEQRKAAIATYRADTKTAREARHTAIKKAIAKYRDDRKQARAAFRVAIGK
ncbi:MAG: hypothetical protein R2720_08260 [Candidatus Nanopelagicales bacterium]